MSRFILGTPLQGAALDSMARDYAGLLALGDGGAYVALLTDRLEPVTRAAEAAGLTPRRSSAGTWQFLSFPPPSGAAGVFFGSGWIPPADPDSVFAHPNGAVTLAEAWLQGDFRLGNLLKATGAASCGPTLLPDGRRGKRGPSAPVRWSCFRRIPAGPRGLWAPSSRCGLESSGRKPRCRRFPASGWSSPRHPTHHPAEPDARPPCVAAGRALT